MQRRYLNDPTTNYIGGLEQADIDGRVAAIAQDYAATVVAHAPLLVGPGTPHEVQEFVRTSLQMGPHVASHVTQTVFVCDLREQLRQVTVPCSIIQTMDDVVLPSPPATARFIADRLVVQPTVHMMNAGGHLPHLTAAEETASLIMPHLGD